MVKQKIASYPLPMPVALPRLKILSVPTIKNVVSSYRLAKVVIFLDMKNIG